MKSKLVAESAGQRTFVVVLEPGEEAFATLTTFAVKARLDNHIAADAYVLMVSES